MEDDKKLSPLAESILQGLKEALQYTLTVDKENDETEKEED